MSDNFDGSGLTLMTLAELREELVSDFEDIYGDDINVEQNSPDGQQINIWSQGGADIREIIQQVNAGFDPYQASGRILDQRVALKGIKRNSGTYTTTPVSITVTKAVNLVGLDDQSDELEPDVSNLFTVKDDSGNEFYLLDSVSIAEAGTAEYEFRAADIGQVEIQLNTITTAVTVIAGVSTINNPSGASEIGVDEETDARLKIRFAEASAITSIANINGLQAALNDLDGVSIAIVRENNTQSTDSDGTPSHYIWCIVSGGDDTEIAETIATRKTHGAGMRGDEEVNLKYSDGRDLPIYFDRPTDQDLYIRFSIYLKSGGVIDTNALSTSIVENLFWQVGDDAVGSTITAYILGLNSDYVVTGMQVSDDGVTWLEVVSPSSIRNRFINKTSRITIT